MNPVDYRGTSVLGVHIISTTENSLQLILSVEFCFAVKTTFLNFKAHLGPYIIAKLPK